MIPFTTCLRLNRRRGQERPEDEETTGVVVSSGSQLRDARTHGQPSSSVGDARPRTGEIGKQRKSRNMNNSSTRVICLLSLFVSVSCSVSFSYFAPVFHSSYVCLVPFQSYRISISSDLVLYFETEFQVHTGELNVCLTLTTSKNCVYSKI